MLKKTLLRLAAKCPLPYHIHLKTNEHDVLMEFALNRIEDDEDHMIIFVCSNVDKAKFFELLEKSGHPFNYEGNFNSIYVGDISERTEPWSRPNIVFLDYKLGDYEHLAGFGFGHDTFIADASLLDERALTIMKACQSDLTTSIVTYGIEGSYKKELIAITDEAEDLNKIRNHDKPGIDIEMCVDGLSIDCYYLDHCFMLERESEDNQWYMRVEDEESYFFSVVCDGWISDTEGLTLAEAFLRAAKEAEIDPLPTLEEVNQAISGFINKAE
ncbi:hypothetical protein [Vibrio parahaemolyticus]|uniref:hypothetical protein n=1 Tax=Vibrio parahaemolyticus TaxID=670 RepID=UPI000C9BD20D|nr:hypothetical protein [Vibrio parahaemolyticus]PMS91921.1 hypothetical protein C1T06_22770 [Vibrio parahaemolyticus]